MRRVSALTRTAAVAFALCALLDAAPAQANLIVNGDFNTGIPAAPGWIMTGFVFHRGAQGPEFWFGAGTTAENGPGIIAFNAGDTLALETNTISQTFGTVAGASYVLEFDFGVTGVAPNSTQQLTVSVFGSDGLTSLFTDTVSDSNDPSTAADNSLTSFNFVFTANGGQATLRFSDVLGNVTPSIDGVLDNVSVLGPAPAPEPATLALLGIALAGLGHARRRGARRI